MLTAQPDLPTNLVVGTMCHCDEPDECSDHWEFFTEAKMSPSGGGIVSRGRGLSESQMRAIAALVNAAGERADD